VSRYLVTSALPYANGPIHFGHIAGAYLPADVYVRTLRMQGEEVLYICGADEHGTAITVNAEAEGIPYADYVARWRGVIKDTFDRFGIRFDVWSGTSICPEHPAQSQEFFRRLGRNGYLEQQESEQLYCPHDRMFLADRYILGTCYLCGHDKARGNECSACGQELEPLKMAVAACKICGTRPERRKTRHWYLDLSKLRDEHIGQWFQEHEWKPNVTGFIGGQLKEIGLRPITRDMSWGIPVPADCAGSETGKVLYVWFDAPIGYISFTQEWARLAGKPEDWKRWWQDPDSRIVHFLGKDNISFHCLIFPSMLYGVKQGYQLPWAVPANEFYNLQGGKFSTSERRTIPIEEYCARYDTEAARYYLLASSPESADSDWRWEDFQTTVNAQLADKIGNLVTRVLRFLEKNYEGVIPPCDEAAAAEFDRVLLEECGPFGDPAQFTQRFQFRRACEQLIQNAVLANVFVDRLAPWTLRKTDPARAGAVLATCCQWIALLARWMAPFMPSKAMSVWEMLGCTGSVEQAGWPKLPRAGTWRTLPAGQKLGAVGPLFAKIEKETVAEELAKLAPK
jgi:methionyl-tRNA synthetase